MYQDKDLTIIMPAGAAFKQYVNYIVTGSISSTTYTKYWPPSTNWRLCQRQLIKVKTIYRFNKLVFYTGDSSLEYFNRATQNYALWQPAPVIYLKREKWLLSLLNLTMKDEECMFRECLNSGLSLSCTIGNVRKPPAFC